ncbi:MAG TPA: CotH kinase family protein, partial [Candidatus Dormibacteraeota bacterium]|nr:CotH kinase family protein [Candidatus Dormibacteraeota bacterium]
VAWINGVEVGRANAPANLAWNSAATGTHPASSVEVIRLGNPPGLLRPGTNILAIQGLNLNAADQTFLIYPQLTGTSIASAGATGVYFTSPTPGGPNSGGSTTPGPIISSVQHTPNVPKDAEDLTVTARIQASFAPVASVTMHYRIMFDTEASVPMFDDGGHGDGLAGDGLYGAVIPANLSTNGQMIRYYISARDVSGNGSRWPLFTDPANTAEYLGTIVDPTNVVSKLPIVHLFVSPSQQSAVDGQSGGRASVFYDGEFYDNVQMQVRGNTTAGYVKKSHRVEFNREHTFRHPGPGGRVRKTSFMAEFIDPSYVRQYLSFWLLGQVGHNTPYHYPVRLQQNGVFYQLAFHSEVLGEEQASRYGFDPRGVIYKACGVVAVSPCSTGGGPEKLSRQQELGMADYTALASAVANTLPVAQRRTNLFDIIDIPDLINYLAVSRLSHEQDDIWANLSLYRDSDGDRMWRVLPFDLNLSWGQLYGVSNVQATNDSGVSHPFYGASTVQIGGACGGFNHLLDAVVQVPETRQMFLRRLRTVMETFLQPPGTPNAERVIEAEVRAVTNLLYPEAILDRQRWGWATGGGPGALPSE